MKNSLVLIISEKNYLCESILYQKARFQYNRVSHMNSPKVRVEDRDIVIARVDGGEEESFSGVERLKKVDSGSVKRRTKSFHPPIETHWHLPLAEGKREGSNFSIKSLLSFSLMKLGRSKSKEMVLQGAHDPKHEEIVESFRTMLSLEDLLPPKHDNYHTLLRYMCAR